MNADWRMEEGNGRRGRSQDRKRVAGGQDYEVRYETKKTGKSKGAVKSAVKRAGTSRKKVEKTLGRRTRAKPSPKRASKSGRSAQGGASITPSKVKRVAKKAATGAVVAAGLAAADTVLGELSRAEKTIESSTPQENE